MLNLFFYMVTTPFLCAKFHGILNWSLLFGTLCGYINKSTNFVMYVPNFVGKIKFCVKVMQEESLIMCVCGNLNFSQLCI